MKVIQLGKLKIEAPLSSDSVAVLRGNQVVRVSLESLIGGSGEIPDLATVATTGKYSDLLERPTLGDGLSESNFTLVEKQKLEGIAEGANNFSLPQATSGQVLKYGAQGWEAGTVENTTYTATNGIKLVGTSIEAVFGSTASTITQGNDPRLMDSREWTASVVTQSEAETGTATTARKWTAQRVRQATLGWWNSSSEKTKLDGLATGATKNATDAQLRNRTTHTGEQPISTVTGLQSALDTKVNNDDARLTNSREWTASAVSQAEAEAGTSTTARKWTSQRVRQNVTAHWNGVTSTWGRGLVNSANAAAGRSALGLENVDNTSDINKPISSATQSALDSKVNKETGKTLISSADLQKLSGIEAGAQVNLISVDNLTSDSATRPLSAKQGKVLKSLVDSINTLLQSDDSTLDELQEIVDFIKLNREDLDSLGISSIAGLEDALSGKQPLSSILTGTTASFTSALKTKLDAIAAQATKNSTDAQLRDRATHTGTQAISTVSGLQTSLDSKVDKVTGKGLSTEDFTSAEKTKLAGVAAGATKNATDAQLRDRSTHTGTQAISTVSGLQTALDGKVDNSDSRLTNSREWTASVVSQAEAEAGTATTARKWTAQRVAQAISALGLKIGTTASTAKAGNWMPTWANVTGKPTTFTPSAHTHSLSEVTDAGNLAALNTNASTANFLRGDGTWVTPPNTNTTYAEITAAEIDAGTASTLRTITGRRMKYALDKKSDTGHGHVIGDVTDLQAAIDSKANTSTQVIAGTGLTGGGTLAANRTLNVSYGTAAGTSAQGNDSRIVNAVPNSRSITAGNGLSGGGTLAANRTITLGTPTEVSTSSTNSVATTSHSHALSEAVKASLAKADSAIQASDLGTAATRNVGTSSGNVMQVGAFGLGGQSSLINDTKANSFSNNGRNEFFYFSNTTLNKPSGLSYGQGISISYGSNSYTSELVLGYRNQDGIYWRGGYSETNPWQEIYHTGNFDPDSKANTSTQIIAGTGLTGGGTLAANRTLNVSYGTTAGTAAQGNDSRIVNAVPNSRTITAGTGLTGGGTLEANRTLAVTYGTTAGTAAQGNDSRLSNSREWTASVVSQAEAEAGTATTARKWTSQRVRQNVTSYAYSKAQTDNLIAGATTGTKVWQNKANVTQLEVNVYHKMAFSSPRTLKLPLNPPENSFVELYATTGDLKSTIIDPNGKTLMGLSESMEIDRRVYGLRLEFLDNSWRVGM